MTHKNDENRGNVGNMEWVQINGKVVIDCVESDNGACGDLIIISLLTVIDI